MKVSDFLKSRGKPKAKEYINSIKEDAVKMEEEIKKSDTYGLETPFIDPIDAISGPLGFAKKLGAKALPKLLSGSLASEPFIGGAQELVNESMGGLPEAVKMPINIGTGLLTGGALSTVKTKALNPLIGSFKPGGKSEFLKNIAFEKWGGDVSPVSKDINIGENTTTKLKKLVNTPSIDTFLNNQLKRIPKALEMVPGGKAVNKALMYGYRGDLPNTKQFNDILENTKINQSLGIDYAVDLGKRLQSYNEADQIKLGQYIRGETEDISDNIKQIGEETKGILFNLGKQAVDVGILSEETFFKNAGRYMPRLYTSKEYQSLSQRFRIVQPNKMDLSRVKKRKDIPKEIRKQMGEILTPGYPVAKGIAQLTHDIEMGKFFKGIAKNNEWSKPVTTKRIYKQDGTVQELSKTPADIPSGWVQLGNNKKLGHLKNAFVHPEIADEINYTIKDKTAGEKLWNSLLGNWKFGKVILSPKTHIRNVLSNSVLAHLGGFPMWSQPSYLNKAIKELKNGGAFWEAGKKTGLLDSTFIQKDLRNLFSNIDSQIPGGKYSGMVSDVSGIGKIVSSVRAAGNKMADAYQVEEQAFKLAKMMYNVEKRGMDPNRAAQEAEKWLFNYGKLTKFQDQYKTKWYGAPFATFTFKSTPRIMEAAIKTPWRFAAPLAVIGGLEMAAQSYIGDSDEQIKAKKELRPEWMRKGLYTFPRVPLIDDYGREHYLNLGYIMPWGDLTEGGAPSGIMPMSQPIVKELYEQAMNRDSYFDKPIADPRDYEGLNKNDQLKQKSKDRLSHVARTFLPTPVSDVQKIYSAVKNEPDYRGRFRSPSVAAADAVLGVKMYPVDYAEQLSLNIFRKNPQNGIVGKKIQQDIKKAYVMKAALEKRGVQTDKYDIIIQRKLDQLKGLAKESGIFGETYKKTKGN